MKGTLTASSAFHVYKIPGVFELKITKIKTKCDFFVNKRRCSLMLEQRTERVKEVASGKVPCTNCLRGSPQKNRTGNPVRFLFEVN